MKTLVFDGTCHSTFGTDVWWHLFQDGTEVKIPDTVFLKPYYEYRLSEVVDLIKPDRVLVPEQAEQEVKFKLSFLENSPNYETLGKEQWLNTRISRMGNRPYFEIDEAFLAMELLMKFQVNSHIFLIESVSGIEFQDDLYRSFCHKDLPEIRAACPGWWEKALQEVKEVFFYDKGTLALAPHQIEEKYRVAAEVVMKNDPEEFALGWASFPGETPDGEGIIYRSGSGNTFFGVHKKPCGGFGHLRAGTNYDAVPELSFFEFLGGEVLPMSLVE